MRIRRRTSRNPYLAALVGVNQRPTNLEVALARILQELREVFVPQARIGRYTVDAYLPDHRLIIEVDGMRWHGTPAAQAKDAKRDAAILHTMQQKGEPVTILRLPDSVLLSRGKSEIQAAIRRMYES